MTSKQRAIVTDQSKPALKRHVRLQYDPIRSAWALLAPEKVLWPDNVSFSIIRLCDGQTLLPLMIDRLAQEYEASADEIRPDVIEFLQTWSDRSLVQL